MSSNAVAPRGLFICYRRSDSSPWTGRLADDLRDHFGDGRVYRDLEANRSAQDYRRQIDEALDRARAVIAVIGPTWAEAQDPEGQRRLDDTDDLVRAELERALASGIALVPVLVGEVTMPAERDLPPSLRTLTRLHGHRLRDEDWRYDFARLLETLEGFGITSSADEASGAASDVQEMLTSVRRYERSFQASQRRAYDAVLGAIELLRYPRVEQHADSVQVVIDVRGRRVTCKVIDGGPGRSKVVIEFPSVRTGVAAGGTLAATVLLSTFLGGLPLAAGAGATTALRALEKRFASGFLDNVESVMEGRGIGEDSSLPPGVVKWRNRSREV